LSADAYTASVNWGDGQTSTAQITQQPDGSFAVTGSHDYTAAGVWNVDVTLTDNAGNSDDAYLTAISQASPLTSTASPDTSASLGDNSGLSLGSFYDLNPSDLSDYAVSINWGDGTTSAGTVTQDSDGVSFDVSGSHNYASTGNMAVSYTVTKNDDPSSTLTASETISVTDPNAVQPQPTFSNLNAAQSYLTSTTSVISGTLATFTATADPSTCSASIEWGDGTTSTGQIIQQPDGSYAITGSHDYGTTGVWSIDVTLTDSGGNSGDAYVTAISQASPLTSLSGPCSWSQMGDDTSSISLGNFYDLNPGALSDYNVAINWGDGTTSQGSVSTDSDGISLDVSGSHGYTAAGDYSVSYTVTRNDDPSALLTVTGNVYVYDPSTSPVVGTVVVPPDGGPGIFHVFNTLAADGVTGAVAPTFAAAAGSTTAASNREAGTADSKPAPVPSTTADTGSTAVAPAASSLVATPSTPAPQAPVQPAVQANISAAVETPVVTAPATTAPVVDPQTVQNTSAQNTSAAAQPAATPGSSPNYVPPVFSSTSITAPATSSTPTTWDQSTLDSAAPTLLADQLTD
jgi:hypothetical protein